MLGSEVRSDDFGFLHVFIPGRDVGGKVLLLLHGTGGNENDLLTLGQMIDERAVILAPRGKVLENGMPRFFRRLGEGVFDVDDLVFRTNELADFIEKASEKYAFSLRSVTAAGYSNGANIAASLLLLRPEVVKSAALLRPMIPLIPSKVPDLSETKVFISGGRYDKMIPQDKTLELKEYLQKAGANVKINWEDATHVLVEGDIVKTKNWLRSL